MVAWLFLRRSRDEMDATSGWRTLVGEISSHFATPASPAFRCGGFVSAECQRLSVFRAGSRKISFDHEQSSVTSYARSYLRSKRSDSTFAIHVNDLLMHIYHDVLCLMGRTHMYVHVIRYDAENCILPAIERDSACAPRARRDKYYCSAA